MEMKKIKEWLNSFELDAPVPYTRQQVPFPIDVDFGRSCEGTATAKSPKSSSSDFFLVLFMIKLHENIVHAMPKNKKSKNKRKQKIPFANGATTAAGAATGGVLVAPHPPARTPDALPRGADEKPHIFESTDRLGDGGFALAEFAKPDRSVAKLPEPAEIKKWSRRIIC
jgi:hypothetical protein